MFFVIKAHAPHSPCFELRDWRQEFINDLNLSCELRIIVQGGVASHNLDSNVNVPFYGEANYSCVSWIRVLKGLSRTINIWIGRFTAINLSIFTYKTNPSFPDLPTTLVSYISTG